MTTKLDENYSNKSELECDRWFSGFASVWFTDADRTPRYHPIDWSGNTHDGRIAAIELKTRNYDSTMKTAWIESSKLLRLLMAGYYEDKVPLYINHWSNNRISVHRLLPEDPLPLASQKRAKNPGMGNVYTETLKCELDMDDAWLFDDKTYKLIRGPKHEPK